VQRWTRAGADGAVDAAGAVAGMQWVTRRRQTWAVIPLGVTVYWFVCDAVEAGVEADEGRTRGPNS
jgi:hypothetical protein